MKQQKTRRVNSTGDLAAYCQDLSHIPLLTPVQEARLGRALKSTWPNQRAKARELLVRHNLRFAFRLAKRFQGRGLDLSDLVQEAAFGLLRAVKDYDPGRSRFCTHAGHWIKQFLTRACTDKGRLVRVPVYQRRLASLYERAERELTGSDVSFPDQNSVMQRACKLAESKSYGQPTRALILGGLASLRAKMIPLHALDHQGDEIHVYQPVSREIASDERMLEAETHESLRAAMNKLPARQRQLLELRCGFSGEKPLTLSEISDKWGCTRERVRQMESLALAALREDLKVPPSTASIANVCGKKRQVKRLVSRDEVQTTER